MAKDSKKNSAVESGMRGAGVQASAGGGKNKKLAGGAASMSVRRADNGYIVSCEFPYDGRKYRESEQSVFASAADVAEFIEKKLGVKDSE